MLCKINSLICLFILTSFPKTPADPYLQVQSLRQNSPKLCLQRLRFGPFLLYPAKAESNKALRLFHAPTSKDLLKMLSICFFESFCNCSSILKIFCYILIIQLFIILVTAHHFGMAAGCFDRSVLHINYLFHTRRSLKRMRDYN